MSTRDLNDLFRKVYTPKEVPGPSLEELEAEEPEEQDPDALTEEEKRYLEVQRSWGKK